MISVIIPVYNVEAYLEECLDSVLRQTHTDYEAILVDDGSTDGGGAICDAYAARDARFRVIHQRNQGLSAARNTGIDAARGEYLLFLDSDDYLPDDALEILHSLAVEHDADFVAGTHWRLFEDGRMKISHARDRVVGVEVYTGADKIEHLIRVPKQTDSVAGRLFGRSLFEELRFPVGKLNEDVFMSYRLVDAAERTVYTEKPSYVYRKRAGSIMRSRCSERHYDVIEGRLGEQSYVLERYPHLAHHTHVRVFATTLALIIRSAGGIEKNSAIERQMQRIVRKYLKNYLKCRAKREKKLLAMLAFVNIDLARLAVRMYLRLGRGGSLEEGV